MYPVYYSPKTKLQVLVFQLSGIPVLRNFPMAVFNTERFKDSLEQVSHTLLCTSLFTVYDWHKRLKYLHTITAKMKLEGKWKNQNHT